MTDDMKKIADEMAKVAEKNFCRVKDKLLEDSEMPLMERKAMMSIAKNAAKLMAYSVSMSKIAHEHRWTTV